MPIISSFRQSTLAFGLLGIALLSVSSDSAAEIVIAEGGLWELGAGSSDLACVDLLVNGRIVLETSGSITGVRSLFIASTGVIELNGATLQLAQQFSNDGDILNPGQVIRVAGGSDCPVVGAPGVVYDGSPPPAPSEPRAIPTAGGVVLMALSALLALLGGAQLRRRDRHKNQQMGVNA